MQQLSCNQAILNNWNAVGPVTFACSREERTFTFPAFRSSTVEVVASVGKGPMLSACDITRNLRETC